MQFPTNATLVAISPNTVFLTAFAKVCPGRAIFHYMNCTCVTSQFVLRDFFDTFHIFNSRTSCALAQDSSAKLLRILCPGRELNPHPVRDTILSRACIPKDYISHHPMVESTILLCPGRAIFHYMNCTCVTSQFVLRDFFDTFHIFNSRTSCALAQDSSAKLLRILCPGRELNPHPVRDTILSRACIPIPPPGHMTLDKEY